MCMDNRVLHHSNRVRTCSNRVRPYPNRVHSCLNRVLLHSNRARTRCHIVLPNPLHRIPGMVNAHGPNPTLVVECLSTARRSPQFDAFQPTYCIILNPDQADKDVHHRMTGLRSIQLAVGSATVKCSTRRILAVNLTRWMRSYSGSRTTGYRPTI